MLLESQAKTGNWTMSAKEEELKWSEEASSCVSRMLDEMGRKGWMLSGHEASQCHRIAQLERSCRAFAGGVQGLTGDGQAPTGAQACSTPIAVRRISSLWRSWRHWRSTAGGAFLGRPQSPTARSFVPSTIANHSILAVLPHNCLDGHFRPRRSGFDQSRRSW
jgi:hypothetical protein